MEDEKFNFKKQHTSIDSLGTRYDYQSVMHYGPRFFSRNGLPTIVAKKPWINIGQRVGLSPIDAIKINLLYKKTCQVHTLPPVIPTSEEPSTRPPSPPLPGECGVSPVGRVIGGEDSKPGNWPWQVGLYMSGKFICGGSLVSPTWVVTAAHCVTSGKPSDFFVRLGDNDRDTNDGCEQSIKIKRIQPHPKFDQTRLNNDIALLELSKPAILNKRVGLVCLPPQDYNVSLKSNCYITGWGKIKHPGSSHPILQQANMSPISQADCEAKNIIPGIQITPEMLCAGQPGSNLSGCHGDSGGPYVCQNDTGRWVLQGAVSWGSEKCDAKSLFTVFARVAKFRTWMDSYIRFYPASPPPPTTKQTASPATATPPVPPPPPIPSNSPTTSKPPSCGLRNFHGRIVGGTEALKNSWPWQVMLRDSSSGRQFCGGSLVHPLWVITAAHCVEEESLSSFSVRLGAHYRTKASIGTEQDVKVAMIVPHPSYHEPIDYSNDIALLKLAEPARLGKGIGLACLANNEYDLPIDGISKCYITGWGTLSSGGSQPDVLMQASVPLVSKERCLEGYPGRIDDSMLCAGLDKGGVDACQGDSGGPLVCKRSHQWYLEGATSWGWGCAQAGKYGVYAKVRHFRSWIMNTMEMSPPVTATPPVPPPPPVPSNSPPSSSTPPASMTSPVPCASNSPPTTSTVPTSKPSTIPTIPPECTNYTFINDSDRAMTKISKQFKCDINLITGWYRFHGQAGQQMPTSCVKINHCGANAPGWINGTHPSVADGASAVQVCFNWGHNCCRWSTYIRVRNCSGFYVYELKKTPGCRLRYCGNGTQGPGIIQKPSAIPSTTPPVPLTNCGISSKKTRVIGGVNAQFGNWPWQVALLKGSYKSFSCGGSLIAPDWVVTAAHCITAGK
ncbi:transmembrane protease serine 9-like [Oculina patagonica]